MKFYIPMQLNFINTITVISIFQALILSIGFFFKKKETGRIYNKIFAAIIFVFSLQILVSLSVNYWSYVYFTGSYKYFYIIYQTAFLISPLIYFYFKSISDINFSFRIFDLLHFLPFILICPLMAILLFKFDIFLGSNLVRLGIITHSLIYIIILFRYLKAKGIKLRAIYKIDNIDDFMKFILICYVLLWIVNVQIFAIIKYITFAKWCAYVSSLYALSVFIFINGIVFLAYYKPNIFVLKLKYANNNLEMATKDLYFTQLINFMKTNKPFLEPVLSLSKLSNDTNIPSKYISQIVNDKLSQNFSDYINTFRVEESKIYLNDPEMDCLTIQEIYYKSGFNSKSTFNLVFKKHTGLTPLEYRKCKKI